MQYSILEDLPPRLEVTIPEALAEMEHEVNQPKGSQEFSDLFVVIMCTVLYVTSQVKYTHHNLSGHIYGRTNG